MSVGALIRLAWRVGGGPFTPSPPSPDWIDMEGASVWLLSSCQFMIKSNPESAGLILYHTIGIIWGWDAVDALSTAPSGSCKCQTARVVIFHMVLVHRLQWGSGFAMAS